VQEKLVDAVEAQVVAAKHGRDAKAAAAAVDDVLAFELRVIGEGERSLARVEEALYMAEFELENSRDEIAELRSRVSMENGDGLPTLQAGVESDPGEDGGLGIGEEIVEIIMCDGSCEVAEALQEKVEAGLSEMARLEALVEVPLSAIVDMAVLPATRDDLLKGRRRKPAARGQHLKYKRRVREAKSWKQGSCFSQGVSWIPRKMKLAMGLVKQPRGCDRNC